MAIGVERFASLIKDIATSNKVVSFITLTSNLESKPYKIAHQLRSLNSNIILDLQLSEGSLKSKLRKANKNNSEYAIIIGEEELRDRTAVIKFLNDELKDQETVSIKELFSFYTSL